MRKAEHTYPEAIVASAGQPRQPGTQVFRATFLKTLARITDGQIVVVDACSRQAFGSPTRRCPLSVTLTIYDPSTYRDIVCGGTLSAGEAYMSGKWKVSDLTALIRIVLVNRVVIDSFDSGLSRIIEPLRRLAHWYHRNTRDQGRRNIRAHYDLGDELFCLFLDPTMNYSALVYPTPESSLDEAAIHKMDLVCRKLGLDRNDHLLEIGTGWGGLAIHAASRYGCRVTTTTISENQFEAASRRVRESSLGDRIRVINQDYRDLDGSFDKLVSIEMIEAVGHDYLDTYLSRCGQLLSSNGRMLIQAILMADQNFSASKRTVDFIQKYIFPGGALPSMPRINEAISRVTDMRVSGLQDISQHYARTLRDWRERFLERLPEVRSIGYPDEFIRMWEYYLCYCEGAFRERAITSVQLVCDKPDCRLDATLSSARKA